MCSVSKQWMWLNKNVIKANNQRDNESKTKQAVKIAYEQFQDKLDNFNGSCSQAKYMCRFVGMGTSNGKQLSKDSDRNLLNWISKGTRAAKKIIRQRIKNRQRSGISTLSTIHLWNSLPRNFGNADTIRKSIFSFFKGGANKRMEKISKSY